MCDDETPHDYFTKYEQAMRHNGEPETQWGHLLPVYLSSKALAAFKEIPDEFLHDYNAVKTALLNSLGDTPSNAGRRWWTLARQSGETYNSLYLRVYTTNLRQLDSANDRQSIIDHLAMSRFMSCSLMIASIMFFLEIQKTGRKAADFATEFAQTRSFAKRHNHTCFGPHHSGPHHLGSHHVHGGVASQRLQLDTGKGQTNDDTHNHHYRGEHVPTGAESQGVQSSGDSKQRSGASGVHKSGVKSKSIVCHSCGEPGHIRPNGPNRVKRVSSPTLDHSLSRKDSFVKSVINDTPCDKMFIDSGCEVTCVAKHLVPTSAYTGKITLLKGYKASSQPESHPIAKVRLRLF